MPEIRHLQDEAVVALLAALALGPSANRQLPDFAEVRERDHRPRLPERELEARLRRGGPEQRHRAVQAGEALSEVAPEALRHAAGREHEGPIVRLRAHVGQRLRERKQAICAALKRRERQRHQIGRLQSRRPHRARAVAERERIGEAARRGVAARGVVDHGEAHPRGPNRVEAQPIALAGPTLERLSRTQAPPEEAKAQQGRLQQGRAPRAREAHVERVHHVAKRRGPGRVVPRLDELRGGSLHPPEALLEALARVGRSGLGGVQVRNGGLAGVPRVRERAGEPGAALAGLAPDPSLAAQPVREIDRLEAKRIG